MPASVSRRDLLKWASAGAGAAAVGGGTWLLGRDGQPAGASVPRSGDAPPASEAGTPGTAGASAPSAAAAPAGSAVGDTGQRLLVVVEMDGGNDGMSMLVPYGMGPYYDLRTRTAVAQADVLTIDDQVGFHGRLVNVHRRGAAVIQGVGSATPDGSHFEMMRRWWAGDANGTRSYDTGILGRLADAIGDPSAAAVAVSVGTASHPSLLSRSASTLAVPDAGAVGYLVGANDDDKVRQTFQRGFAALSQGGGDGPLGTLRSVGGRAVSFAERIGTSPDSEGDGGYPGSTLGRGLRLAAQLLTTDLGVRIVHVPMQEDFDTHDDHGGRYPGLMQTFDDAIEAFFTDIEAKGLSDRVLVMTTSEFGRTAKDNASSGLDHGTASNMLLMGPVSAGLYGEHPSLTTLDDNDDLVATVGMDQYFATIAEGWFGVPSSEIVGGAAPITGMFS